MSDFPKVSRELQLSLALVITLSAVALLKPEPLSLAEPAARQRQSSESKVAIQGQTLWSRQPVVLDETSLPGYIPLPDASAIDPPEPYVQELSDQVPMSSPEPNIVYLGRLQRAQESYVFLDTGEGAQAFKQGDLLNDSWQVSRITEHYVQLRDRQSGSTRRVSMERNNEQDTGAGASEVSHAQGSPSRLPIGLPTQ